MRRWGSMMVALMLTGPSAAIAVGPPQTVIERGATERPNLVLIDAVEGLLPRDSSEAQAFRTGVSEAFEPDFYLTERAAGESPRVSMALANRFRLVHGDPFGDEWRVRAEIVGKGAGLPDSLEGLLIRVAILSPEAVESGARPEFVLEDLSFDVPLSPRSEWFAHAGRAAGLVAVEALHRRSGDLEPDTRVRIDGTVRKPIGLVRSRPRR